MVNNLPAITVAQPQRGRGRPTTFTEEIGNKLCARVAGGRTLKSVCTDDDMPGMTTVFYWFTAHPEFAKSYTRSQLAKADVWFDEMHEVARQPIMGQSLTIKADGGQEIRQEDMLGHRRLLIDTLKWSIGKLNPKKYSDKLQLEHTGAEGGPVQIVEGKLSTKDAAEMYARTISGETK